MVDKDITSVYFLGIGGIGMSALARYFRWKGARVAGYDKTPTPLTDDLIREGMSIHFREDTSQVPSDLDLVITTPAIPDGHEEYRYFRDKGIAILKRAQALGEIASGFPTIAVAGTHGKTTTSTLIAHLFRSAGRPLLAFLGGISRNWGTNFIWAQEPTGGENLLLHGTKCIVEADEYDRSFLQLSPDLAVITSIDPDHLDIYSHPERMRESFSEFAGRIRPGGYLILKKGVELPGAIPGDRSLYSYSLKEKADFFAAGISVTNGITRFDLITPEGRLRDMEFGLPGLFNLENAVAGLASALISGIAVDELRRGLKDFRGVMRRFDLRIRQHDMIYIDDYAHHPEELRACIGAVRELFPGKRITGVFQPHLYSRTRDFADDFAKALSALDCLILLDIYPAREAPIEGVSSKMLLERAGLAEKQICRKEELLGVLEKLRPEVLLTLGAGDIDQFIVPITQRFCTTGKEPSWQGD